MENNKKTNNDLIQNDNSSKTSSENGKSIQNMQEKQVVQQKQIGRRAEIKLYEADYENVDGYYIKEPEWKPVNFGKDNGKPVVVTFNSPADIKALQSRYALCDQKFEIIRWLDPIPEQQQSTIFKPTNNVQQNQVNQNQIQQNIVNEKPIVQQKVQISSKPKFYKIGNIDIKEENGNIYQKQWVQLSTSEMENYRIINNKTNAVISLVGKTIEVKKWIIVEDSQDNMD